MKYLSLILISMASFSFSLSAGSCSPSAKHNDSIPETKTIYFAGGCFWGTEHFFKQVRGVVATEVGYANGNVEDPSYEELPVTQFGRRQALAPKMFRDRGPAIRVVFDENTGAIRQINENK